MRRDQTAVSQSYQSAVRGVIKLLEGLVSGIHWNELRVGVNQLGSCTSSRSIGNAKEIQSGVFFFIYCGGGFVLQKRSQFPVFLAVVTK